MTGIEALLSAVLMIFIFGIFVSFVVLMGVFRAQEVAERRQVERREEERQPDNVPEKPSA